MKRTVCVLCMCLLFSFMSTARSAWLFLSEQLIDGDSKAVYVMGTPGLGTDRPMLMIGNHPAYNIRVIIGFGYHTFNSDTSLIRVKFNNKAIEEYPVATSTDYRNVLIENENAQQFIEKLKKSTRLIVELDLYSEGPRSFTFNTKGFNYNKVK